MNQVEIRIQAEPIDVGALYLSAGDPASGGRVVFTGCVRPEEAGQVIEGLDYEHYEGMAEKELRIVAEEACERWGLHRMIVVHRVGFIGAGEESIVIVATAGHRAEAFDGARYMIDELKKRVPIWKASPESGQG